jgi:hypothetical protein
MAASLASSPNTHTRGCASACPTKHRGSRSSSGLTTSTNNPRRNRSCATPIANSIPSPDTSCPRATSISTSGGNGASPWSKDSNTNAASIWYLDKRESRAQGPGQPEGPAHQSGELRKHGASWICLVVIAGAFLAQADKSSGSELAQLTLRRAFAAPGQVQQVAKVEASIRLSKKQAEQAPLRGCEQRVGGTRRRRAFVLLEFRERRMAASDPRLVRAHYRKNR